MSVLLDTHILIYWLEGGEKLSNNQRRAIEKLSPTSPGLLADISLWEVAMLTSLKRITLRLPLRDWLQAATSPPLMRVIPINPTIAAEIADLPENFHRDPADRIIVSTARTLNCALLTNDRKIRSSGLVETI